MKGGPCSCGEQSTQVQLYRLRKLQALLVGPEGSSVSGAQLLLVGLTVPPKRLAFCQALSLRWARLLGDRLEMGA
jgi:hypothetical protein